MAASDSRKEEGERPGGEPGEGNLHHALRPNGDRARAGTERGDARQQLRLHLLAAQAAAGGAQQEARLATGREPGVDQILALGREQSLPLAILALAQPADQLQLLVLGAGDHRHVIFGWFKSSPGTKKRAVKTARPGVWSVGCG